MNTMIVKIQAPLFSTEEKPPCLVYNKSRSFITQVPMTDQIDELLNGDPKGYFEIKPDADGKNFEIEKRVGSQPW